MLGKQKIQSIEGFFTKHEALFHRVSEYSNLLKRQPGLDPADIHDPAVSILTHLFSFEKVKKEHKFIYAEKHLFKSAVYVSRKYISITLKQINTYISRYGYDVLSLYVPDFDNTKRIITDCNGLLKADITKDTYFTANIAENHVLNAGELAKEWFKFISIKDYLEEYIRNDINKVKSNKRDKLKENIIKYLIFAVIGAVLTTVILEGLKKYFSF